MIEKTGKATAAQRWRGRKRGLVPRVQREEGGSERLKHQPEVIYYRSHIGMHLLHPACNTPTVSSLLTASMHLLNFSFLTIFISICHFAISCHVICKSLHFSMPADVILCCTVCWPDKQETSSSQSLHSAHSCRYVSAGFLSEAAFLPFPAHISREHAYLSE